MHMGSSRSAGLLVAVLCAAAPLDARAQTYSVGGEATVAGEHASFTPVVAMFDKARNHVSLLFPSKALPAAAEAASRKAGQWELGAAGPSVVVDLDFAPGTSAMADHLKACHLSAAGFRKPLELKGGASECHILSVGGMLGTPGALMGIIQGQSAGYSLRLPFSLTLTTALAASGASAGPPHANAATPAGSAAPAGPSIAPNSVTAAGTYNGQRVTAATGVAAWNAGDQEIRIGLFAAAPPAGAVKSLLSGDFNDVAPVMTVYLRIDKGALTPQAVSYCYVDLDFPKGGTMGTNTSGRGCGITEIGGTPAPGGSIAVRMKAQTMGPGDKPFAWDAAFNLPIAK
jgi:hypothetical protein